MNVEKVEKALANILEEFYPNKLSIKILEVEVQKDSWIVKAEVSDNPSKRLGHEVIIVVKKYEIT
ncbi:MAG: hypothetical protein QXZ02_04125 [Candidatus Bathyarchaeia archaeon]